MKKYQFKLEPLLNHRRFVEDIRQKTFADVEKKVAEAKHIEKCLEEEHLRRAEELKEKMQAPRPASENALYATYLTSLSKRIEEQRQQVQAAEKERDEKRSALLEAVKNRKTLERLKEVRTDQYEQIQLKKEQEFTDEIGIQQHNRKTVSQNRTK